jgi:lipopolysaccharide/colanic/teichoic acid biosynthesis glycosyltransferase
VPYRDTANRRRKRIDAVLLASDSLTVLIAVAASAIAARDLEGITHLLFVGRGSELVTLFIFVAWMIGLTVSDSRDPQLLFAGTTYYERTLRGTFYPFAVLAIAGFAFNISAARPYVLVGLPIGLAVVVISRWLVRQWALSQVRDNHDHWLTERALIIRSGDDADDVTDRIPHIRQAASFLSNDVEEIVSKAISSESTMVLLRHTHQLTPEQSNQLGWRLNEERINLCVEPKVGGLIRPGRTVLIPHPRVTLLSVRTVHLSTHDRVLKRGFDLVLGALLFVALSPIAALGALGVFVTNGRPIFYKQKRVGTGGSLFTIRKLRTMTNDAETFPCDTNTYTGSTKDPHDPRITPFGHFLRRWSIDELPQLLNVIRGDMSLVGPRPRLESELSENPITSRRLRARPGLTGVWQTSGRANIPLDQADLLDVEYVDNWTILGDLVILLRTVRSVLRGDGAF